MCSDGPSDKSRPRFMRSEGSAPGVVTKGRGFERDNDVYENRWMKWLDVRPAIDDEEKCDEGQDTVTSWKNKNGCMSVDQCHANDV